jgi:hypothetical protein
MSTTQIIDNLVIIASKHYIITSNTPFDVKCIRFDGSYAEMVNAEIAMKNGRYFASFDTTADARLFVNDEEVTL